MSLPIRASFSLPLVLIASLNGAFLVGCDQAVANRGEFNEESGKLFAKEMDRYLANDSGKEKLATTIEEYFRKKQEEAQSKAKDQAMKRAEADIEKYFANPLKVEIGGSPVKGPADAKVTIFEFSDFECPYCKRGFDVVEEVLKAYPNDVKVVFKNMPLEFHNMATPAAKAALAAQKQGKFWEFHDELFKNQQSISEELFPKIATTLGLDMEKFKADMNSPEVEAQIKSDISIAKALDITGTPGFIVAGIPVKGAYPFEHFKKIIDRSLNGGPAKG